MLEVRPGGGWWFTSRVLPRVAAGITDRQTDRSILVPRRRPPRLVEAEQVHGASVAVVERSSDVLGPIAGCDALVTSQPGIALLIRTADCLPIFVADPARGVIALAHAGWRGLSAHLPMRVVAALQQAYHCRAEDLRVAIGPAIHSCCYEVGPEFGTRFGPFVTERGGRRTCDLAGVAVDQLRRCGVRTDRMVDSGICTACDADHWFSLRREGQATGRLTSIIMLRP